MATTTSSEEDIRTKYYGRPARPAAPPASKPDDPADALRRRYYGRPADVAPETPASPAEPGAVSRAVSNLANLPKVVTEGLPAAKKAFDEAVLDPAPTYGEEIAATLPRALQGTVASAPAAALSTAARLLRGFTGVSKGVAELGPERAKPLTETLFGLATGGRRGIETAAGRPVGSLADVLRRPPKPGPLAMLPEKTATAEAIDARMMREAEAVEAAAERAERVRGYQPTAPLDIEGVPLGPPASPLLAPSGRPAPLSPAPSLSERVRQRELYKGRLDPRADLVGPEDTGRPFGEPAPWTPERPAPGQVRTKDVRLDVAKRPFQERPAPLELEGPLQGPPSSALVDATGRPVQPVTPSVPTPRRRFLQTQPPIADPERAKLRDLYKGRMDERPDLTGVGPVGGPMQPFGKPGPWNPPEGVDLPPGQGRPSPPRSTIPSSKIEETFGIELDQPQAPITPAAPGQAVGALDEAKRALDTRALAIGERPGLTPTPGKLADPEWQRLRDQVQRGYRTGAKAEQPPVGTPEEVAGGYKGKARELGVAPARQPDEILPPERSMPAVPPKPEDVLRDRVAPVGTKVTYGDGTWEKIATNSWRGPYRGYQVQVTGDGVIDLVAGKKLEGVEMYLAAAKREGLAPDAPATAPAAARPVGPQAPKPYGQAWVGQRVTITDGSDRGVVGTVRRVLPHPTRGDAIPVLEVRSQHGGIHQIPSNMVERGKVPGVQRPPTPQVPTRPAPPAPLPEVDAVFPKQPGAPRFEKTAIGDQGVIGGTPDRAMPTGALKPTRGQADIKDTALFGQERRATEASQGTFDVDAGMRGTQQHAVNEWLVDQLGGTFSLALKGAKSPTSIPPAVQVKLRTLGLDPTDAWQAMNTDAPPPGVLDRLVAKSMGQKALPAPGDAPRVVGSVAPSTPPRAAPFQRAKIKGDVPDLADPDDVLALVQGAGRLQVTDAVAGELRDVPHFFKSQKGMRHDRFVESLRESYPSLGTDDKAIWDQVVNTMRGYISGRRAKAQGAAPSARDLAGMPDEQVAQAEAAHLKRSGIDPEGVVTGRVSDQPIPPEDTAFSKLMDFFSDIGQDEAGMLRPERFAVTWKRWRQKLPMESAVRRRRPSSPILSGLEQFNAGATDDVVNLVQQPWWNPRGRFGLSQRQGLRHLDPDAIKDAEEAAYKEWWNNGRTGQAELAARRHFAPEMQEWMALRDRNLPAENMALRFFDKDPIHYASGPYVPRRLSDESREVAKLHREGGAGASARAHLQGHEDLRTEGPTYRRAEQKTGREYEDPRNAILLREWDGIHLRRTHEMFDYLLRRKGIFRTEQAAQQVAQQIPGAKPWRVEGPGIPGGTWWTATEEEARLLTQNLSPHTPGSLVHYANALLRNPNLVNPAPHVTKNMLYKYTLANGPVKTARLGTDAAEYLSGRAATKDPHLFKDFQETMAFSEQGQTAGEVLGRELHKGPGQTAVQGTLRALGAINRPSQKVIFQWADPAMRYGLYKSYRRQGMDKFEAANHAWEDLVRYGTRSEVTDFWRKWPTNFFVPWRFGSAFSVVKQLSGAGRPTIASKLHHAARAALVIGGAEYLREMRYRATGRWTHLPTDYIQKPVQEMLESGSPLEAGLVLGTMAVFGPGGEFSSRQIGDITKTMAAHGKNPEAERFKNAFWGISQIAGEGGAWEEIQRGNLGHATMGLLFGEHGAHSYEPRRLAKYLPESLPGMGKSEAVTFSEADQQRKQRIRERREERREQRPKRSQEQRLRDMGLIR